MNEDGQIVEVYSQPERLNPETPQYDKEKDDAMGQYYASQINIVEVR